MGIKFGFEEGKGWLRISGSEVETTFPLGRRLAKTGANAPAKKFTMGTLSANLSAILEFLTTQTDTKYLARPRLLTLSNETAEIKITTNEAVGLETTTTAAEGTSVTTRAAERAETGVSLKVTPQVNPQTGDITLLIEPKVKEAKPGATFDGILFKDPEERGTKSIVRVKDGQTIIIGGLLRTEFSTALTKVPFLGDIPILGALFRHRYSGPNKERELLVFITPHIIKEERLVRLEKPEILEREQEPLILERKEAIEEALKDLPR
jgi:type II secretory pathway component GspD/PulD (secretin)